MTDGAFDIRATVAALSLDEKAALTAGADLWHTVAIPRLGIPALVLSDGPSGARGVHMGEGPTSALFPCGTALAATWSPELAFAVGAAIAEDARTKGANVLLGPTMNLHRSPLAGRNFECHSEDPLLSARIAVGFVRGVQSRGVAACAKHFVANDQEFERMSISAEVGERALRELYLVPFEAAVREGGAWCVMSAYNRLNGTFASEHPWLLGELLKGEWGFDGVVVSDWYGTYSDVQPARAGLDLEMPGPARHLGAKLAEAVRAGALAENALDAAVLRLLRLCERTGAFERAPLEREEALDRPEHRALARRAAAEAIVLLKNDALAEGRSLLPLDARALRSLALIGPNAAIAVVQGGGSARVHPHHAVSPLEGIAKRCGDGVSIACEPGCTSHKTLPALRAPLREGALRVEYWNGHVPSGAPARSSESLEASFTWFGRFASEIDPRAFSARVHGVLAPRESGDHQLSLISAGKSRLFVDGELVVDNWTAQTPGDAFFNLGSSEVRGALRLEAGRKYELAIEFANVGRVGLGGLKIGALRVEPAELMLERAVARAAASDAAIVVVGLNDEWESEGHDRTTLALPGRQRELVERVAAANPRTVVVVNAGAPVDLEWLARVPAAVQLWYAGQESGHALADVLFGDVNPSGRLPHTVPRRIEDTPAFLDWPGERGRSVYSEGLFVGYRWYERRRIEPRLPFGHGLSYTRFEYAELRVARPRLRPGESQEVSLEVANRGARAGQEVVQLYVRDLAASVARPEQELRAFEKVALAPGESRRVRFTLEPRALSFWDPALGNWVAEPGEFELCVGASSQDVRCRASFVLEPA
ncbi:MAG TPA: glycoside hydrolase family 3 C-terminal domain-containing protein [Myxococcota bacterium]|nr:glycoside hydrolase family 3 C-terminal domain-containing protein [Myxococcota bacterium]